MAGTLADRLKFGLWKFSRKHPIVGRPIRWAAAMTMRGADQRHRHAMAAGLADILPADYYVRAFDIPTQAWILEEGATANSLRGMALLLNHLRVPFRQGRLEDFQANYGDQAALVLVAKAVSVPGGALVQVVDGERLLPHRDGLRSDYVADLLAQWRSALPGPLVTGMLPPSVAMRIDDINGIGIREYLPPMLACGWKPNLGIFVQAFAGGQNSVAPWLADLAKEGHVSISPHALSETDLLFFDLAWGRPRTEEDFLECWARVEAIMAENQFPLSSAVNAHFYLMSTAAVDTLVSKGARHHFSEFTIDSQSTRPDSENWPSGDPLHCTGRLHASGLVQIAVGDNMATLMNSDSHYDFLMHIQAGDVPGAARRAMRRLQLSLDCGFPAFITSHEFLLCDMLRPNEHQQLWQALDVELKARDIVPQKIGLDALGGICESHRTSVLESVCLSPSGGCDVTLSGNAPKGVQLRVLGPGGDRMQHIAPFQGLTRHTIALS